MIKHLLFTTLLCFGFINILNAQERYVDPIFEDVTITSDVVYSDVTNFYMDVYEPTSDTISERPLLIFAHGGAFIGGDPSTSTSVDFCTEFAKRGYVTASIQYKLADFAAQLVDSLIMKDVVMKAVGDAKAAIRFFNKDAENDNIYRTAEDRVFVGGNSAGAILSIHAAYLDESDEIPEDLLEILEANGGFEGNRGNEGYSSEIAGVLNLAGGLNALSLIDESDVPTFSAHGDIDDVVPYDCNDVYWSDPILGVLDMVDICGSSEIHPILENFEIPNELITYENATHTPWSYDAAMRDDLIQQAAAFFAPYAKPVEPEIPSSINNNFKNEILVFPNPVNDVLTISLAEITSGIANIFDLTGKQVLIQNFENTNSVTLNTSAISAGAYILEINSHLGKTSRLLVVE